MREPAWSCPRHAAALRFAVASCRRTPLSRLSPVQRETASVQVLSAKAAKDSKEESTTMTSLLMQRNRAFVLFAAATLTACSSSPAKNDGAQTRDGSADAASARSDGSTAGIDSAVSSTGGSRGNSDGSALVSDGPTSSDGSVAIVDTAVTSSGGSAGSNDGSATVSDGFTSSDRSATIVDTAVTSTGGSTGSNDGSAATSDGLTGSGGSDGGIDSAVTGSGGSAPSGDGSTVRSDGVAGSGGSDAGVDADVAGSGGSVADISCDFTTQGMHLCTGFSGLTADAADHEQTVCVQQNQGTFSQAACLTANVSATCTFTSTGNGQFAGIPAGIVVTYVWYSLSAGQIAPAQQVCATTLGGTWSGG